VVSSAAKFQLEAALKHSYLERYELMKVRSVVVVEDSHGRGGGEKKQFWRESFLKRALSMACPVVYVYFTQDMYQSKRG
jgi:hypothetical protein